MSRSSGELLRCTGRWVTPLRAKGVPRLKCEALFCVLDNELIPLAPLAALDTREPLAVLESSCDQFNELCRECMVGPLASLRPKLGTEALVFVV